MTSNDVNWTVQNKMTLRVISTLRPVHSLFNGVFDQWDFLRIEQIKWEGEDSITKWKDKNKKVKNKNVRNKTNIQKNKIKKEREESMG